MKISRTILPHGARRDFAGKDRVQEQNPVVAFQESQEGQGAGTLNDVHPIPEFSFQESGSDEPHVRIPQKVMAEGQEQDASRGAFDLRRWLGGGWQHHHSWRSGALGFIALRQKLAISLPAADLVFVKYKHRYIHLP